LSNVSSLLKELTILYPVLKIPCRSKGAQISGLAVSCRKVDHLGAEKSAWLYRRPGVNESGTLKKFAIARSIRGIYAVKYGIDKPEIARMKDNYGKLAREWT
jgi:hypothetical protein